MIQRITAAEFEAVRHRHGKHRAEAEAIRGLEPATGVKFPCTWIHYEGSGNCGGTWFVRHVATRVGFKVATRCKDRMFYVLRET